MQNPAGVKVSTPALGSLLGAGAVSLIVTLITAALSAAGVIKMALAVVLLTVAWAVSVIAIVCADIIWSKKSRRWPIGLLSAFISGLLYTALGLWIYHHQPEPALAPSDMAKAFFQANREKVFAHLQARLYLDRMLNHGYQFHISLTNGGMTTVNVSRVYFSVQDGMQYTDTAAAVVRVIAPGSTINISSLIDSGLKAPGNLSLDIEYDSKLDEQDFRFEGKYRFNIYKNENPSASIDPMSSNEIIDDIGVYKQNDKSFIQELDIPEGTLVLVIPELKLRQSKPPQPLQTESKLIMIDPIRRRILFSLFYGKGLSRILIASIPENGLENHTIMFGWGETTDKDYVAIDGVITR